MRRCPDVVERVINIPTIKLPNAITAVDRTLPEFQIRDNRTYRVGFIARLWDRRSHLRHARQ